MRVEPSGARVLGPSEFYKLTDLSSLGLIVSRVGLVLFRPQIDYAIGIQSRVLSRLVLRMGNLILVFNFKLPAYLPSKSSNSSSS